MHLRMIMLKSHFQRRSRFARLQMLTPLQRKWMQLPRQRLTVHRLLLVVRVRRVQKLQLLEGCRGFVFWLIHGFVS
uniref:Uncharacterized protein n=1 Tax=Arundo donax TaxID=35708 RepID=A0A0A9F8D5_ARUDO